MRSGMANSRVGTTRARIEATVTLDNRGCWIWQGAILNGYGTFSVNGKMTRAHRASYTEYIGEIPEGLVIDHLCRNTRCVNPDHLEAVTQAENVRRSMPAQCVNGHAFDDANTYWWRDQQKCRACRRENHRRWKSRKRSEVD